MTPPTGGKDQDRMSSHITARAPRAHCYACGSNAVSSVCHACGRAMCKAHEAVVHPAGRPTRPGQRASEEFARLGLSEGGAYHCEACDHIARGWPARLFLGGALAAALGLAVAFASAVVGILMLMAGLAAAGGAIVLARHRRDQLRSARPPAPFDPTVETIQMTETIRGEIRLGDRGGYTPAPPSLTGILEAVLSWPAAERERLREYRKRFALDPSTATPYAAGFLRLVGQAGIAWGSDTVPGIEPVGRQPILALRGSTSDHPFLDDDRSGSAPTTRLQLPYTPQPLRKIGRLPLTVVPTLESDSGRRTLRLDIQWLALGDPDAMVAGDTAALPIIDQVEKMELHVPGTSGEYWGNVENVNPEAISHRAGRSDDGPSRPPDGGSPDEPAVMRTITWERLPVLRSGAEQHGGDGAGGYRYVTVTVRFEQPIDTNQVITGRVVAAAWVEQQKGPPAAGLLSGVQGVALHDSRGGKPRKLNARMLVRVDVDFSLSLRNLRYQERRVVPDAGRESDRELRRSQVVSGAVPDYRAIIALTDTLSADARKYYVKGVVEHPSKTRGARAHTDRAWDITGRYYEGVYPIDFHIAISGEETSGGPGRRSGKSLLKVSTSGVYTHRSPAHDGSSSTPPDSEDADMQKAIVDCQVQLHDLALSVLEGVKRADGHADGEVEVTYAGGGAIGAIGSGGNAGGDDDGVVDAEFVEDEVGADPGMRAPLQLGPPSSAAPNQQRRRRISDLLLEGRISEETYNRLIADLEAEETTEAGA